MKTKIIVAIIIIVVVVLFIGLVVVNHNPPATPVDTTNTAVNSSADIIATATFTCSDGKSIDSTFRGEGADLKLSDGRSMSLQHVISADGARYANADESFVFWNKGKTAFITENGTTTFADCVTP